MTGFFHRREDDLEDRLRSARAEPRDEFVSELSGRVRGPRFRTAARSRRFVAALVTTCVLAIPFVAFGGVSYAATAAKSAVHTVIKVDKKSQANANNPTQDQYRPGKGCGDKNHIHLREGECKKPPK
ncbi:MAG: hypothetical protein ACJ74L_13265 [Gaiellaceae bacterium]